MAKKVFRKLIQIGRVVFINNGRYKGRLAAIVDIIDGSRGLIDGPCTRVPRQALRFADMYLTNYVLKINRGQREKLLRQAWNEAEISKQFAKSRWSQNLKKGKLRDQMTDYCKYKVGRAKQTRNKIVRNLFNQMKNRSLKTQRKAIAKKRQAIKKPKQKVAEKK
ncbi:hypothetical protein Pcinc_034612 [Petrolisthes cinctipes]|uniref:Large ribosomal subunit protein eL14 n=1 Tax=Petrolisthes cinctipes TaxID=88211 RepID=A0AAE1EPC7_PETCI|nr:hypothetical protein Pcinc_034612 [Petrolisthes cinctipes]